MATLIRIKRRMDEQPLDSILVRPKWRKVDVGVDEEVVASVLPSSAVVELVATVDSKETSVEPKLLRKYRKGWELKQKYKSLEPLEDRKDVERKAAKERVKERRDLAVATLRGTVTTTTTTEEEIEQEATGSTANGEMDDADDDTAHYYDTHISSKDQKDVITCNGQPMESEKYVYDIYYYPDKMDYTNFICEENRFMADSKEKEEEEEEEDDENEEENWRNDYPEEEEEEEEEEEDMCGFDYGGESWRGRGRQQLKCGSDESFDADEYEEEEEDACFDESGNIILDSSHILKKLTDRLAETGLGSDGESD